MSILNRSIRKWFFLHKRSCSRNAARYWEEQLKEYPEDEILSAMKTLVDEPPNLDTLKEALSDTNTENNNYPTAPKPEPVKQEAPGSGLLSNFTLPEDSSTEILRRLQSCDNKTEIAIVVKDIVKYFRSLADEWEEVYEEFSGKRIGS